MIDVNTINEELNRILTEGDIKITKKFRKKIIKCISPYNISEEKLGELLEIIIFAGIKARLSYVLTT